MTTWSLFSPFLRPLHGGLGTRLVIIPASIPPPLSLSQVYRVPEVYIFQFNAPLYFANVGVFRSRMYIETGVNPSEFEERDVGCFQKCCTRVSGWEEKGGKERGWKDEGGREKGREAEKVR